jgi:hypothetical protein
MSDDRTTLIRLIAEIDQRIAEAESLANNRSLDDGERKSAAALLDFRRNAVQRVERMLKECEG